MRLLDLLPSESAARWKPWLARASSGEHFQVELEYSRDGVARHFEISLNPIHAGSSIIGVAVFSRDVSERRRAESEIRAHRDELEKVNARLLENQAQLIQSEKLASLGQLAAGVAHEINNPMAFVTSNLRTLSRYVGAIALILEECRAMAAERGGPGLEEAAGRLEGLVKACKLERILGDIGAVVSESLEGAQRVNEIVQSLKSIARADDGGMEPTDLVACVEDALKLAWNEIKHSCEVFKEYSGPPTVLGRPGQLKQVFLNLLINAAQAIPGKGNILIRAGTVRGKATVEIEDNGAGIAEADMPRIFTPFFTTKPVGQGTGLGLPISYGIVQNHHGEMKVRSEPGKGTVFTVTLPAWDGAPHGEGSGGR
jgi:two-component system NtrC family sensor kinase